MIINFDLDDTLGDYTKAFNNLVSEAVPYPQQKRSFYDHVEPIEHAITALKYINMLGHQCKIVTAPSVFNVNTYTGKARWIQKNLGSQWLEHLVITSDKSLIKGHVLFDDYPSGKGQENFEGKLIIVNKDTDWVTLIKQIELYKV